MDERIGRGHRAGTPRLPSGTRRGQATPAGRTGKGNSVCRRAAPAWCSLVEPQGRQGRKA